MDRLLQVVKSIEKGEKEIIVSVALDSLFSLSVVARSSEKFQKKVNVYVEIDVGLGRVGIKETEMERIYAIVKNIMEHKFLEFKGILSHAGQVY